MGEEVGSFTMIVAKGEGWIFDKGASLMCFFREVFKTGAVKVERPQVELFPRAAKGWGAGRGIKLIILLLNILPSKGRRQIPRVFFFFFFLRETRR